MFEPFTQGADPAGMSSGLGLAIARQLAALHGGSLTLEPGPGTAFRFSFAVGGASDDIAPTPVVAAPPSSGPILVVDDHPLYRALCQELLASLGHPTAAVGDGREALQALAERPHAAVLLDQRLPGMDGVAVLQELRRTDAGRRIPVIAISADTSPEADRRLRAAGADDVLHKPLTREQLGAALAPWVGLPSDASPTARTDALSPAAATSLDTARRQRLAADLEETLERAAGSLAAALDAGDPVALSHAARVVRDALHATRSRRLRRSQPAWSRPRARTARTGSRSSPRRCASCSSRGRWTRARHDAAARSARAGGCRRTTPTADGRPRRDARLEH